MPKVTILMTSYNHESYIKESIESVLNQTFIDFELIIVDDCSTDASFKIIKSFKDKRIKAIRNEQNMGPEHAFEILHKTAKGELIAIADSDNVWERDKLEKQVLFLEKNSKYAAVFTRVNMIDGNGQPFVDEKSVYYDVFDVENRSRQEWLRHFFFHGNCLCHPSVLIRREAYKKCRMVVNGLWQVPDLYKWIRLCLKDEIYVLEDRLINFRLHENNISGERNLGNILRGGNEVYQIYDLFYEMNKKDFLLAFDEASEYVVDGKINIKFALSRLMFKLGIPALQTLGLNRLFEILNNERERKQVLELYGYNDVSYKEDETKYSPFVLPSLIIYRAKLYFDFGKGFNEGDTVVSEYVVDAKGKFSVSFEGIDKICDGRKIIGLRFDPCDYCSKIKIEGMVSQGRALTFELDKGNFLPSQYTHIDGYDVFYVGDPAYIVKKCERSIKDLTVFGEISVLTLEEAVRIKDEEIDRVRNDMAKMSDEKVKIKGRVGAIKQKIIRKVRAFRSR